MKPSLPSVAKAAYFVLVVGWLTYISLSYSLGLVWFAILALKVAITAALYWPSPRGTGE